MDKLLTPIKSITVTGKERQHEPSSTSRQGPLESLDDVLETLKTKPDLLDLRDALGWLRGQDQIFNDLGPKIAEIRFTLLDRVIPNFWPLLRENQDLTHRKVKIRLHKSFENVAGLASLVSHFRLALTTLQSSPGKEERKAVARNLDVSLDFLVKVLASNTSIMTHWKNLQGSSLSASQKSLLWKNHASTLASGRLLALAAEASESISETDTQNIHNIWIANGKLYSKWLGCNLSCMLEGIELHDERAWKALGLFFSKSLTLGFSGELIEAVFHVLLSGNESQAQRPQHLISHLAIHEQKKAIACVLHSFSSISNNLRQRPTFVGGMAAVILNLTGSDENRIQYLSEWLIGVSAAGLTENIEVQEAVALILAPHTDLRRTTYERGLQTFGDKLYIQHAPLSSQEACAKILCLLAGHLHRLDNQYFQTVSNQSLHLDMVSNRLASSASHSKHLGMVFAMVVSSMIDPNERALKFEGIDEDFETFIALATTNQKIGSITDLQSAPLCTETPFDSATPSEAQTRQKAPTVPMKQLTQTKIVAIEEVGKSDGDSDDEGMLPFAKPDTDESDEEDATLVQRNKPSAPVYIRDLLAGLQDTENFDRHRLALQHAENLIRRKANFGSEVTEHIEELATQLIGLDDKYEIEDFQQLRLNSMIAVLLADPPKMGPWFSATFFNGDYSMDQRVSILSTIGLGTRELAGLSKEDSSLAKINQLQADTFPSKKLPDRLHRIYAAESAPVNKLSSTLESSILRPIAAEAADKLTGPNALKVRTFSSRLSTESRKHRVIPNQLAKVVADAFFLPLVGRWRTHRQAFGDTSIHDTPLILSHYIKTLSLILNASGPSTLSLPRMTTEFWDLLLAMRNKAQDMSVLEALLFGLLVLLSINDDNHERLAADHSKQLLETREWVQLVYRNLGGDSKEDLHRQSLAEGVLVMISSVIEKYQRAMLGDLVDYISATTKASNTKMKRKAFDEIAKAKPKVQHVRAPEPDYCDVEPRKDGDEIVWPAPSDAMEKARTFIQECAHSSGKALIVPDKDADGLDAGVIIHRTLEALGKSSENIDVHLLPKGATVHDQAERESMLAKRPSMIIVVDQGSRPGPRIVDSPDVKCLIIDHHLSDEFPQDATVVSACHYPPVATSSLLTYEICRPLHPSIEQSCSYLCVMGTHGDLGATLKWKHPFPNMDLAFKMHTKKAINDAVSLINAPRRTARFDVSSAWEALLAAKSPKEIMSNKRLLSARAEINEEVERQTHTPPKFSKDGKIAVLRINSDAQVHPVIATRWASHLNSRLLEIVLVANTGYTPGMVNFSCRIARVARSRDPPVNIIESLKAVAALDEGDLIQRMGESFARGHKEASGGIIPVAEFEELMALMKVGEKPDPIDRASPAKKKARSTPQKNNLMNYFGK